MLGNARQLEQLQLFVHLQGNSKRVHGYPKQTIDLNVQGAFSKGTLPNSLFNSSIGSFDFDRALFTLKSVFLADKPSFDIVNLPQLDKICADFNHPHPSHINVSSFEDNNIKVLLRADAFWFNAECDIKKRPVCSPYSIQNLLGCTMTGPMNQKLHRDKTQQQSINFTVLKAPTSKLKLSE